MGTKDEVRLLVKKKEKVGLLKKIGLRSKVTFRESGSSSLNKREVQCTDFTRKANTRLM